MWIGSVSFIITLSIRDGFLIAISRHRVTEGKTCAGYKESAVLSAMLRHKLTGRLPLPSLLGDRAATQRFSASEKSPSISSKLGAGQNLKVSTTSAVARQRPSGEKEIARQEAVCAGSVTMR